MPPTAFVFAACCAPFCLFGMNKSAENKKRKSGFSLYFVQFFVPLPTQIKQALKILLS